MTTPTTTITPCPTPFSDHIYKVAHGVDVPLRIWAGGDKWLLWFHGGAFAGGKHWVPNAWIVPAFREKGYTVVSAAYRLLPHVGIAEILQDSSDAYGWCRAHLGEIVPGIDIDAVVVGGDSAGGMLSSLAGIRFDPPPRVVLCLYAPFDLTDPHFHARPETEEERAERAGYFPYSAKFTEEEIIAFAADRDPSSAVAYSPWTWELEPAMSVPDLQTLWGMDYVPSDSDYLRMDLVCYRNRKRDLFDGLLRRDTLSDSGFQAALRENSSLHRLDTVTSYPPTFLLHGDADRAVPVAQSRAFQNKLEKLGVPVDARYDPTGQHCFENKIEKCGDDGWEEYVVPAMDFIDAHIRER